MFLLLSASLFFGCSTKQEQPPSGETNEAENEKLMESEELPQKTVENEEEPEESEYTSFYPLTGVGTDEPIDRRPVSVMVNNHVQARPQSGLTKADIVFEFLTEGSITRFLAIYQSEQPDVVGPVRSAREYFFEIAQGYEAIYIFHGAARSVNDLLLKQGVDHLNGSIYDNDGYLFKRESFRKAPHNSYLLFDAVYEAAETKNYDIITEIKALPFIHEDTTIQGDFGQHIIVSYPGRSKEDIVEFIYHEDEQIYTRKESKKPTVELNTEDPVQVHNVLVIEADHEVGDQSSGRRKIDLKKGGHAYLFQKGIVQKVEWINDQGQIIPFKDGNPVGFTPGKTWINVVPSNPGIEAAVTIREEEA